MYAGLLSFCALIVFGIAGLTATFEGRPEQRHRETSARFRDFTVPPNVTDKQVADLVYGAMRIPLSTPIPSWAVHRNGDNQLQLEFYTLNGIQRVVVLEKEHRLRIEEDRADIWHFLGDVHAVTVGEGHPDIRIRLWSWYNELAIWSLIGLSVSGVYLWLASRPRFRWAQLSFTAGCGVFLALYVMTR